MGKGKKNDKQVEEAEQAIEKLDIEDDEEGEDDENAMELSGPILKRIVALKNVQEEEEKLAEEHKKERCALEAKFNALRQPLFDKRSGIISGKISVSTAEDKDKEEEGDIGIPGFWLQALANHHVTGEYITEEDVDGLECLEDIRCTYNEDMTSFTLTFVFGENSFFKNKELTKVYTVDPDLLDEQSPTLSSITAPTAIEWKDGKNLTVQEIQKKQRSKSGKKKGQVRYVTSTVPKASFFHFFAEPKDEDEPEEEEEEDEEQEEKEVITFNIEQDYEIAHVIRTSIVPHAIGWYTGELIEDDYDEDDEEGDEDEEDDEDDADEEAVSDDEEEAKGKKGKKIAAAPGAGGPDAQPECKQS